MKNTKGLSMKLVAAGVLTGLCSALISAPAFAQTQSTTVAKAPAPQATKSWSISLMSLTDLRKKNESSIHFSELSLAYDFNDTISSSLTGALLGNTNPAPGSDAQFLDLEASLDFNIPLNEAKAGETAWTLLLSGLAVAPTSADSVKDEMIMGWGANAGISAKVGKWTFTQLNNAYVYSYRLAAPQTKIVYIDDNYINDLTLDDKGSNTVATAEAPSYTYIAALSKLAISRSITSKFSAKVEGAYQMKSAGHNAPDEIAKLTTTATYAWAKSFKTFGGVVTSTKLNKPNQPSMFDEKTTALRLGLVVLL